MICKNINDILTFNKNETKFRHCPGNWVDKRKIVSGISKLWASLKDILIRQENHHRATLIVLKNYFVKLTNKSGVQNPL